ncbi:MAG: hypothetical protein AAFQ98_18840, partial [Bacteroidota bacterium]
DPVTPEEETEATALLTVIVPNDDSYAPNGNGDTYWVAALNPADQSVLGYGQALPGDTLSFERPEGFTGDAIDLAQVARLSVPTGFIGTFVTTNVVIIRSYPAGTLLLPSDNPELGGTGFPRPEVLLTGVTSEQGLSYVYALLSDLTASEFEEFGSYAYGDPTGTVRFKSLDEASSAGVHLLARRNIVVSESFWDFIILEDVTEDDGTTLNVPNEGWQAATELALTHPYQESETEWKLEARGISNGISYPLERYVGNRGPVDYFIPTLPSYFDSHRISFSAVVDQGEILSTEYAYEVEVGGSPVTIPSPSIPDVGSYANSDDFVYPSGSLALPGSTADLFLLGTSLINEDFHFLTYFVNGDPATEVTSSAINWPADMISALPALGPNSGYQPFAESLSLIEVEDLADYQAYLSTITGGGLAEPEGNQSSITFSKGGE